MRHERRRPRDHGLLGRALAVTTTFPPQVKPAAAPDATHPAQLSGKTRTAQSGLQRLRSDMAGRTAGSDEWRGWRSRPRGIVRQQPLGLDGQPGEQLHSALMVDVIPYPDGTSPPGTQAGEAERSHRRGLSAWSPGTASRHGNRLRPLRPSHFQRTPTRATTRRPSSRSRPWQRRRPGQSRSLTAPRLGGTHARRR